MNKQELIEKIKILKYHNASKKAWIDRELVLDLVKQLDAPQKVVVPQFVADWYEDIVDEFYVVLERLVLNYQNNTDMPICKWFFETEDALTILINMHQFGYTVEKEKRYLVTMKGKIEENVLTYGNNIFRYFFTRESTSEAVRIYHTRKELEESGFGWVFDCEGIELEEVQDDSKV